MANLSKFDVLAHMGFEKDPFKVTDYSTMDATRIHRILGIAMDTRAWIAIVGERGIGKSSSVRESLKRHDALIVRVHSTDGVLISDIEFALILDLSNEAPKQKKEVRRRQLRRILGEASMKKNIVVVIEGAHRLHNMTIRAIKNLRELEWMGESGLFSVVLIGQSDPLSYVGLAEVRLRSDTIQMKGMTADECIAYIQNTVGRCFSDDAIALIAGMSDSNNFLSLQNHLITLMGKAIAKGKDSVDEKDVRDHYEIKDKIQKKKDIQAKKTMQVTQTQAKEQGNEAIRAMFKKTGTDDK